MCLKWNKSYEIQFQSLDCDDDYDAALRDSEHPSHLKAEVDSGGRLHPNTAGYKTKGDAIDLSFFR